MRTTKTIKLRLDLPEKAKIGHRMPKIINNLVSAPALCDAECEVKFTTTRRNTMGGSTANKDWVKK